MKCSTSRKRMPHVLLVIALPAMALAAVSCVNPKHEMKQEVRQEVRQKDREDGLLDVGDPVERKMERKIDRKF